MQTRKALENKCDLKICGPIPEGNLFEDRFKSLQRRNIVEPSPPDSGKPRQIYKMKTYTKKCNTPSIKEIHFEKRSNHCSVRGCSIVMS
ncbi:hypothetical protein P5673_024758 [Acropora cervicornis]|uniref:Uncharacterized protein n=1 Tax=Acropora cervicornis TaxID=6130 RepID=A0AAD9Q3C7_ACRCE|nr:hypothetical protein P5673_024758 [Acropora cervicornis]